MDANNRLNRIFHLFNSLISEFSLGNRLIDILPSCFSFHLSDRKNKESKKMYIYKLNKLILQILVESKMAIVISDANIKNQVAISIVLRLKVRNLTYFHFHSYFYFLFDLFFYFSIFRT